MATTPINEEDRNQAIEKLCRSWSLCCRYRSRVTASSDLKTLVRNEGISVEDLIEASVRSSLLKQGLHGVCQNKIGRAHV